MAQKLALFDLDGTLFRWQLYHALVFELKNLGVFSEKTAENIDLALIEWQGKRKTWDEYEIVVMDELKSYLPGMKVATFETAARRVVEGSGHKIYSYTRKLASSLKADGYFLLAVTGSYQEVAEPFAKIYGFDDCIGALLPRSDGAFTGPDSVRAVYGQKAERVHEYLSNKDITLEGSIAVGDSGSDIDMLELATRPIAFNPSVELLDVALERGWQVTIERKNIAYTMQKGSDGHVVLAQTDRF